MERMGFDNFFALKRVPVEAGCTRCKGHEKNVYGSDCVSRKNKEEREMVKGMERRKM